MLLICLAVVGSCDCGLPPLLCYPLHMTELHMSMCCAEVMPILLVVSSALGASSRKVMDVE